jgi:hybrid cluster-associated redox disulfide protein
MKKKEKISKDMTISEVISKHPKTVKIFLEHGMTCMGCPFAMSETVEQAAKAHGLDAKELLEKLNKGA